MIAFALFMKRIVSKGASMYIFKNRFPHIRRILFSQTILLLFFLVGSTLHGEYTVRFNKGDTVYKIAKKYGIPQDILLKVNSIKDPTKIKAGTSLVIPLLYKIKTGDTLTSISKNYGISIDTILKYNKIQDKEKLKPGDVLYLVVDEAYHKTDTVSEKTAVNLSWPLSGTREKLTGKLSGVAITGKPGDTILSVTYGTVIWAGPYRGYGKMLFIKSDKNYIYIYAGNEEILVKVGDSVKKDTPIGTLGQNSRDGQSKAIFCMYAGKKALDPFKTARE